MDFNGADRASFYTLCSLRSADYGRRWLEATTRGWETDSLLYLLEDITLGVEQLLASLPAVSPATASLIAGLVDRHELMCLPLSPFFAIPFCVQSGSEGESGSATAHNLLPGLQRIGSGEGYYHLSKDIADKLTALLTPTAAVPSAPLNPQALLQSGAILVSWQLPESAGSSPITGYKLYRNFTYLGTVTERTFLDDSVDQGSNYTYAVKAVNAVGDSPLSTPTTAILVPVPQAPAAPINPTATQSGVKSVHTEASMAPSTNPLLVLYYSVYRVGSSQPLATNLPLPTYEDTNLAVGKYAYQWTATNAAGQSPKSAVTPTVTLSTVLLPTPEPPRVQADDVANTLDFISTLGASQILVSINGAAYAAYAGPYAVGNVNLAAGYYKAKIRATTDHLESSVVSSPEFKATTSIPQTVPGVPTAFQVTVDGSNATLVWYPPASDGGSVITSYRIYRNNGSSIYATVNYSPTGSSYVDMGAVAGTAYTYQVSAVNTVGEGQKTAASTAVTVPVTYRATTQTYTTTLLDYKNYCGSGPDVDASAYQFTATSTNGTSTVSQSDANAKALADAKQLAINSIVCRYVTDPPVSAPAAPVIGPSTASTSGPASVTTTITGAPADNGSPISGYSIYRNGSTAAIATNVQGFSFTDTTVTAGNSYTYQWAASNAAGLGPKSASSTPVTPTAAVAPTFTRTLTGPSDQDNTGVVLAATTGDLLKFNFLPAGATDARTMYVNLPSGTSVASVDFLAPYDGKQFSFQLGGAGTIYYGYFADGTVTLSTSYS